MKYLLSEQLVTADAQAYIFKVICCFNCVGFFEAY